DLRSDGGTVYGLGEGEAVGIVAHDDRAVQELFQIAIERLPVEDDGVRVLHPPVEWRDRPGCADPHRLGDVQPGGHLVDRLAAGVEDPLVVPWWGRSAAPSDLLTVGRESGALDLRPSQVDADADRHASNLTVPVIRPTNRPSPRVTETEYTPSVRPMLTGSTVAVNVSPSRPPAVRTRWVSTTVTSRPPTDAVARRAFSQSEYRAPPCAPSRKFMWSPPRRIVKPPSALDSIASREAQASDELWAPCSASVGGRCQLPLRRRLPNHFETKARALRSPASPWFSTTERYCSVLTPARGRMSPSRYCNQRRASSGDVSGWHWTPSAEPIWKTAGYRSVLANRTASGGRRNVSW